MSFSGHGGSGGLDVADGFVPSSEAKGATGFGRLFFYLVLLIWVGFGLAMWVAPDVLIDVWEWAGSLSMVLTVIVWVFGLPWMLGLAVWQSVMPELLRVALVAGLALVSVWTVQPKRTA
ncbi:MAG TPA: hypothetical protein VI980_01930 [Acidimicrobiia bacterium]|nr:hypothetical protein [Acidimicrobiia bacterium]